jgi:hypothetical protein
MVTNGMDQLVEDAEIDSFKERVEQEKERTTPGDQSQANIPVQPVLNSPTISPASSLNQVSMAFLPPIRGGQTSSRGQEVFGATDTVFG